MIQCLMQLQSQNINYWNKMPSGKRGLLLAVQHPQHRYRMNILDVSLLIIEFMNAEMQ